jgi:hypothetical protein
MLQKADSAAIRTTPAGDVRIRKVASKADRKAFLRLPYTLYADDPVWHPPLRLERAMQLNPKHNKLMSAISEMLFLAERNGQIVGRIAAFTNAMHHDTHNPKEGFFGFLDHIDDAGVANALLKAAENYLRAQGQTKIVGPAQWSVNEEVGLLIDGFEHPNVLMMSYGKPYYPGHLERAGYAKAVDMLAFQAALHEGYPRPTMTRRMVQLSERDPRLTFRDLDKSDFKAEVSRAMAIYNDAWSENWNALPYTPEQVAALASELKPLMFKGGFRFAELDGEPIAFGVMLPDIFEAIADAKGRLTPISAFKALRRVMGRKVRQARVPLMGLKREHHNTKLGLAAVARICEDLFEAGRNRGFTHCELSWILEDNLSMIRICEQASAVPYKTYRMYEKSL